MDWLWSFWYPKKVEMKEMLEIKPKTCFDSREILEMKSKLKPVVCETKSNSSLQAEILKVKSNFKKIHDKVNEKELVYIKPSCADFEFNLLETKSRLRRIQI